MAQGQNGTAPPDDGPTTRTAPEAGSTAGVVGPYRLLSKLGEGGMGEVWLADQTEPVRRRVALKVIKAGMDTRQVIARFEVERQALALMEHPSIAKVFDAGATTRGLPYFAMEYVHGEPITQYCDRHRLTTRERLDLFLGVCEGIQHAHQKGIIHRDIKPSNVLVTITGGRPEPKIIDFGVAKATAQRLTERTLFTELGMLVGTPEYMSPEQAEMTGLDVDTRTDVYSLGVMLYELLTGALPFDPKELRASGLDEIRRRIREEEPPRPSTRVRTQGARSAEAARNRRTDPGRLVSRLKGDLDWIVMRALEKDRTRRYQTATDLAADIRRHVDNQPVVAGPPSAIYRARKFVRRHSFGVAVSATAMIGLIAFATTMATQARRIARERDRAGRVSEFLEKLFNVSDPSQARGNAVTAREILDKGAEKIGKELAEEPEVQGSLMATMGRAYTGLGLYSEADRLLKDSVEIRRRALGARHLDTLESEDSLAKVLRLQGHYQEAERLALEVLEVRRQVLGPEHPDTLESHHDLASLCMDQGRFDEAEKVFNKVVEARRRVLGPDNAATLASLNGLAGVYIQQARYGEAETIFREVLAKRRRVLGPNHPDTLQSMSSLANVFAYEGRNDEDEKLRREVLGIMRRILGPEHPETLRALTNLAVRLTERGRFEEAEKLNREVIEAQRRVLGPEHPGTLWSLNWLGVIYERQGRYDEAGKTYLEVLNVRRRVLGEDHPDTLWSMNNVAVALKDQGRFDEAERLYRKTIEVRRRVSGPDHPDTLWVEDNLVQLLVRQRRHREAEQLGREVLDSRRRVLGVDHPDSLQSMNTLALALLGERRYEEADRLLRVALESRRRVLGATNPDTASSAYDLACVSALRSRRSEALDRLRQAVQAGFRDADGMARDQDFALLHGDPEFERLLAAARENSKKPAEARR